MPRNRNRNVRGVRSPIPAGSIVGRLPGTGTGAAQIVPLAEQTRFLQAAGLLLGGGGLASIADGDLLANISGGTAVPIANTLTAILDHVLGNSEGSIIQRGASSWQVLTHGTAGQVLESGGASALNSWANLPAAVAFNPRGAWSGFLAYNPFDVVTYNDSAWLNYAAISAPGSGSPAIDGTGTNKGVGGTSLGASVTTTTSGLLCCVIGIAGNAGSNPILTMSDSGSHTWTRRWKQTTGFNIATLELWTAPSSGATTTTITGTFLNPGSNGEVMAVFGLKNEQGFDSNASLPFIATGNGSLSVTTTESSDTVLWVAFDTENVTVGTPTSPALTNIAQVNQTASVTNMSLNVSYIQEAAPISGVVFSPNGGGVDTMNVADAFTNASAANATPPNDDAHWLSQGSPISAILDIYYGSTPGTSLTRLPSGWAATVSALHILGGF